MRIHQGSAPSSCVPSSSSTSCCSSRVPRSPALLPISSSPTSPHYVTLLSTVHICSRDKRTTATLSSRRPGRCRGWINREGVCDVSTCMRKEKDIMRGGERGGEARQEKRKRKRETRRDKCIVPQFVDHDGICIAGAFSDELPSAAFPRQNEIRTCELSS